jgi:nitrous oxidase accessory protein NosD
VSRKRIGCCAAALCALLGVLGLGDAVARVRTTFVVSPGGSVPGSFASIQAAVNAATTAGGDTILVYPGTYAEQVTINRNLTLEPTRPGAIIQAPSTMTPDAFGLRVLVEVNNGATVTIRGLAIRGPNPAINAGVLVVGGATLKLEDSRVADIHQGPTSFGVQTGVAVQAGGSAAAAVGQVGHLEPTGNTLEGYQRAGFVIGRNGSTGTIERNQVIGVGPTPLNAQTGIQISPGASRGVVDNNYVADNSYTGRRVCGDLARPDHGRQDSR